MHLFKIVYYFSETGRYSRRHLSARRLRARVAYMHEILKTKIFVIHSHVNFLALKHVR